MKTIGITGGIGSGKTTVCSMLEEMGARVFYADLEARKLMENDAEAQAAIQAAFGSDSYKDGRLNRSYVASRVFGRPENLVRLNEIVHPRVFNAFDQAKRLARLEGVELLVKEAALIYETGGDKILDAVVLVDAPEAIRLQRAAERDNVTPEQVKARMRHQLSSAELRGRADYIIENTGSPLELRRQVEAMYRYVTRGEGAVQRQHGSSYNSQEK